MTDNSSDNSKIAINTALLYVRMGLILLVSLYTTRIVFKALGVVDYGIYNIVAGFVSMFSFLNTSMSNGIQRYYNYIKGKEGENSLNKVYTTALIIQFVLAIIIIIFLETIGLWYLKTKMVIPEDRLEIALWIYQFSIISLIIVIMQIPYSAAIMAYERMGYYAYVSLFDVAFKLGIVVLLQFTQQDKLFLYGLYCLVGVLINFILYYSYCKKNFNSLHLQFKFHKDLFVDMLSFSGWNLFGTFAYMIKNQGLNVLLNAFFGPIVNAARGISMIIGNAIQGFQMNIVVAFRPQTVQSYAEGNFLRVKHLMYSLSKISYLMLFMFSMPIIIELPQILRIWLGDNVPEYTIPFTILILLIMMFSSLNTPLSQVVHATGKMKNYQMGTSIVISSILPIAWFVLKNGGCPLSVFVVSMIMTIINQVVCMILLKKVFFYSIKEYIRMVIIPCMKVTIMATILPLLFHSFFEDSYIQIIFVVISGLSCTIFCSYFWVLNFQEKQLMKKLIHKYFKTK